jgi:restriction system protein
MNVIFVRALNGELTDTFKQNGYVAIGWLENPLNDYTNWDEIEAVYRNDFPNGSPVKVGVNVGQIYRFYNEIKVGTIVITSYRDGRLLIGQATSEPYFERDNICRFYNRIKVAWKDERFDRSHLSIPTQNTIRSSLTIFRVTAIHEIASLAGINLPNTIPTIPSVVVQHNNYIEAIKQQLLTLDSTEFEIFVNCIMQSLGFESTQAHGGVGDGGTDVEGTLNVLGFASIKLQIQVKRYENGVIGEREIRNFRGSVKEGYQGTYVTLSSFNRKAVESATNPNFKFINLIDGKQLIEVFIEQFDKVIQIMEADESYRSLLDKLRFKKIIIPQ